MAPSTRPVDRATVEAVVQAATRAPSLHNAQPWRFVARDEPSGVTRIDLWASRERGLQVSDPYGRELHIACGAALELARLQSRSLGHKTTVSLLPIDDEPDLLGRIFIGEELPPNPEETRLAAAISKRHTARDRFESRVISEVDLDGLRAAASIPEAWVRFVTTHEDQVALAVLLARADDVERAEPRYLEELSAWLRTDESSPDGVSPAAVGEIPVSRRASSLRLRDFRPNMASDASDTGEEPPPPEHPLPAIVGTVGDDARSWLVAGEALVRLLLEATCRGIGASPMTQVLEVPSLRTMLSSALGTLGSPQMLLRLGYESGGAVTRRRPLSEVLSYE